MTNFAWGLLIGATIQTFFFVAFWPDRRSVFSASGILARLLSMTARMTPKGPDLAIGAAYGIVELFGASRFFQLVQLSLKQFWSRKGKI